MSEMANRPDTTPSKAATPPATDAAASCRVRNPSPSPAPGVAGRTGPGVPVEGAGPVGAASPRRRLRQPALRERRICPRYSASEYAELEQAADACRMTPGGYLAEAGLAAARADNPQAAVADYRHAVREVMAAHRQAAAIGNNLNQLARHLNSDQPLPEAEVVHSLLTRVHEVVDAMDEAVEHLTRR